MIIYINKTNKNELPHRKLTVSLLKTIFNPDYKTLEKVAKNS